MFRPHRRMRVMGLVPAPTPEPGAPAPLPGENPTPGAPVVTPPVPPTPPVETPKTYDEAYVEGLRREAAKYRTEKNTAETALTELQRSQMTEAQKAADDLARLQTVTVPDLQRQNQVLMVQVAASKLGIVDPEVASMLVDWNAVNAGTSIGDALNQVLEARPYLKQTGAPASTSTSVVPPIVPPIAPVVPSSQSSPATPPTSNTPRMYTKSELTKMTAAEMAPILADVNAAAEAGRIDYTK